MATNSGLFTKLPLPKHTRASPHKPSNTLPRPNTLPLTRSVARDTPSLTASTNNSPPFSQQPPPTQSLSRQSQPLNKDPTLLWQRYVDWLYQHKDLGLYIDVSRVGFSDGFVQEMGPRFAKAFKDMEELEKGAIANPDEGRMVGHYWLRNSSLAPKSFWKAQIDKTLDAVCDFAADVVSGKVSAWFPI